jgi:recombination protein RecA
MAKEKDTKQVASTFKERVKELEKKFAKPEVDRFFIPTGSIEFDWALGGGYQSGRIYELIAWEGGGKTTLASHAVAECHKLGKRAVYIDAEHAMDPTYAKAIGVEWDNEEKFNLFQPDCGEEGFEYARGVMETGEIGLIVFDSANGLLPLKQMEGEEGASNLGLHARLLGQAVPRIKTLASKHNVVVIFISQFREKIGVMFGSPETTQGGHALKFWASGRIELRRENIKDGDEIIGIKSKFKVIKNKVVSPYRKGEIPIEFGVGIDKIKEIFDSGKKFNILKPWGQTITYGNDKYSMEEFRTLLQDNQEFFDKIKSEIIFKLNGVDPTLVNP